MVKLASPIVKSPKMAKAKTPKKAGAADTPVKAVVKTPKQAKNTPAKAEMKTPKQAKNTPAKAEMKTPKQAKNTPAKDIAAQQTPKIKKVIAKEAKSTPMASTLQSPKTPKAKKAALIKEVETAVVQSPKLMKAKKAAKSTPEVVSQTPMNGTVPAKKSTKAKKNTQNKPVSAVEVKAAPANSPVKKQPSQNKPVAVTNAPSKNGGEFCLFVRGFNYNSEQDDISKHFQQFGTVKRCSIPRNRTKSNLVKGFGFIEYDSKDAMDKALAASHTLDGRSLNVVMNKSSSDTAGKRKRDESQEPSGAQKRLAIDFEHQLFVAKLKYVTTKDRVLEHFSQFGEVVNVALPMKSKTESKGFAFVAFKDAASKKKAAAKPNQKIDGTSIVIEDNKKPAKEVAPRPLKIYSNELFVGGLEPKTQRATLETHFSKYGKVVKVSMPWNKEGSRNKGFGFVAFESASSLKKAMEEDHEIDGQEVGIRFGKNSEENDSAAAEKLSAKKLKAAAAVEKMEVEEDSDEEEEEEDAAEDDESEEEQGDSDDEEEQGDSDDEEEQGDSDDEEEQGDSDGEEEQGDSGEEEQGDSDEEEEDSDDE